MSAADPQSTSEDLQLAGVEGQTDGNLCSSGKGGTDGKDLLVCTCMSGSTNCGGVVNDSGAMAASRVILHTRHALWVQ